MVLRLLRDKFTDLEEQGAEKPALSVLQMTASLTRPQAAKLFYQICGELLFVDGVTCFKVFRGFKPCSQIQAVTLGHDAMLCCAAFCKPGSACTCDKDTSSCYGVGELAHLTM